MAFFQRAKRVVNILYSPKYLLITNAFVGSTCISIGDLIVQNVAVHVTKEQEKIEVQKIARVAFIGASFSFVETFYYRWLEHVLPGLSFASVLQKVVMDQVLISFPFDLYFLTANRTMETKSLKEGLQYTKQVLPTAYIADCIYWPLFQAINFRFVPVIYRVTYNASVTLVWNIFLCYLHHSMKRSTNLTIKPSASTQKVKVYTTTEAAIPQLMQQ